jgi:hypothetical protein
VTGALVNALGDVSTLIDWLQRFAVAFPTGIPANFGQLFLRVVPFIFDPRSGK